MFEKYSFAPATIERTISTVLKNLFQKTAIYLLIALLSILILVWSLRLWQADLGIPFRYDGDAVFNLMTIKSLVDNKWYLNNRYIGAPLGSEAYDFPFDENITLVILKTIASLSNPFVAHNLFYILTFPLTAVTSLFTLRKIKISSRVAMAISLLYAFVPYHFLRLGHLFLSAYYMVPLAILIVLSLWSSKLPLLSNSAGNKVKLELFSKESLFYILICVVLGSTGMYYAFFSCFLIAVTCILNFIRKRDKRVIVSSTLLILLISTVLLANLLPSISYWITNGINSGVAQRSPLEAEAQGLKIAHLLLPVRENFFPLLRAFAEKYDNLLPYSFRIYNETRFASLGVVGSVGFLLLILKIFLPTTKSKLERFSHYYQVLSLLNLATVLYATVGGFGLMFALLVSPQLRGLNRISIFIAFFSLLAIALTLDKIQKRSAGSRLKAIMFNFSLILILILGLLDQVSPAFVPKYSEIKNLFLSDQEFVHKIEDSTLKNSLIFQLPYVSYPEASHPNGEIYDHFRPYLHSSSLKWSYGAMRGRNDWQDSLEDASVNLDAFLAKISIVGFSGIYVDRKGFIDPGKELEGKLQTKLGSQPVVTSRDRRFAFYNIAKFKDDYTSQFTLNQISEYRNKILYPIKVIWGEGFYGGEKNAAESWRWARNQALLTIQNPSEFPRKIQIKLSLNTDWKEYSHLSIKGDTFSQELDINLNPSPLVQLIELPAKSQFQLRFNSDAKRADAPLDARELHFQVRNFEFVELDGLNEKLLKIQ